MTTSYFYLALTPTGALPIYYSKSFTITYDDSSSTDLDDKQRAKVIAFRNAIGNPSNYNNQWSLEYDDSATANQDRTSEISALRTAGKQVLTPTWP
jgi:hypothetical protein